MPWWSANNILHFYVNSCLVNNYQVCSSLCSQEWHISTDRCGYALVIITLNYMEVKLTYRCFLCFVLRGKTIFFPVQWLQVNGTNITSCRWPSEGAVVSLPLWLQFAKISVNHIRHTSLALSSPLLRHTCSINTLSVSRPPIFRNWALTIRELFSGFSKLRNILRFKTH